MFESSQTIKNFFTSIFGTELIFFCLGNMWKSPMKKLAVSAGALGYDVGVTVISEKVGDAVAKERLEVYSDLTNDEYTKTRNQAADRYYSRYSIFSNSGTFMLKIFSEK